MVRTMRALSQVREDARAIYNSGLDRANAADAVTNTMRREGDTLHLAGARCELSEYREILVLGAGKAGAKMASAVEELLGESISTGLVIVKYGHSQPLRRIGIVEAGHPLPDKAGLEGTKRIVDHLRRAKEKDLVIFFIF